MNRLYRIIILISLGISSQCSAQITEKLLEISLKNGDIIKIMQTERFNFVGINGSEYNGRLCILNDSQFSYFNYFDEVGSDTFHIKEISDINLRGEPEKYKIRPLLVVAGALVIPVITIPVVVYKLLAKKHVHYWISKEEYSIKININYTET